jgi:hypothetical protein
MLANYSGHKNILRNTIYKLFKGKGGAGRSGRKLQALNEE